MTTFLAISTRCLLYMSHAFDNQIALTLELRCKFYETKFGDDKKSNFIKLRTFLTAKQSLYGPGQVLMIPAG